MSVPAPKDRPWGAPVLLGIPLDHNSSYLRGAREAPPLIRKALDCEAWNQGTESKVDIGGAGSVQDLGDLQNMESPDAYERIASTIGQIIESGKRPMILGGDHSITYPILQALGKRIPGITLIQFDAHPDLYADYQGNFHSHASPFARVCEEKLVERLLQVGIRTLNSHQQSQARKYGVEIFEMDHLPGPASLELSGPIYVSFDLDALDPAFAPGVSHWEPGGLSTREAIRYIHSLPAPIIGADLVEFNPVRDATGLTATVAAKILKELLGKMIAG
jgi:arginase